MSDSAHSAGGRPDRRQEMIERIATLPSIPLVLSKIMECVDDPESSAADLKEIILSEQAITAKILSLANSPNYGQSRRVSDLMTAIVVVGFQEVYETAAVCSLFQGLSQDLDSAELDKYEFWMYSVACAMAARQAAELANYPHPEQAYMCGLLHDVGKLVLLHLFKPDYEDVLFLARAEAKPLNDIEVRTFGFTHTEAGGWLAESWSLPLFLAHAIREHHTVGRAPDEARQIVCFTHLAEYATRAAGFGHNGDPADPVLDEQAIAALALSDLDVQALVDSMRQWTERVTAMTDALIQNMDREP